MTDTCLTRLLLGALLWRARLSEVVCDGNIQLTIVSRIPFFKMSLALKWGLLPMRSMSQEAAVVFGALSVKPDLLFGIGSSGGEADLLHLFANKLHRVREYYLRPSVAWVILSIEEAHFFFLVLRHAPIHPI